MRRVRSTLSDSDNIAISVQVQLELDLPTGTELGNISLTVYNLEFYTRHQLQDLLQFFLRFRYELNILRLFNFLSKRSPLKIMKLRISRLENFISRNC